MLTTSTQIRTRIGVSSFSSTESDMASVFRMLLKESKLLEEDKEELDDQGLDGRRKKRMKTTMVSICLGLSLIQINLHRGEDIALI